MLTLSNGGPRPFEGNLESVDYKGGGRSNLIYSEFHHITGAALYSKRTTLWAVLLFFVNR